MPCGFLRGSQAGLSEAHVLPSGGVGAAAAAIAVAKDLLSYCIALCNNFILLFVRRFLHDFAIFYFKRWVRGLA